MEIIPPSPRMRGGPGGEEGLRDRAARPLSTARAADARRAHDATASGGSSSPVSQTGRCIEAALSRAGVLADHLAWSASWGIEKPSPRFFATIAQNCRSAASQIAYVGDRLDNRTSLRRARAGMFVGYSWPPTLGRSTPGARITRDAEPGQSLPRRAASGPRAGKWRTPGI